MRLMRGVGFRNSYSAEPIMSCQDSARFCPILTNFHTGLGICNLQRAVVLDAFREFPVLRVSATLRGKDQIAECTLEMWQEEASSGRLFTRCHIVDDPPELPDGAYLLDFGERSVRTNKYHGRWELTFLYDAEADMQAAA
jgi:hypothetical protein